MVQLPPHPYNEGGAGGWNEELNTLDAVATHHRTVAENYYNSMGTANWSMQNMNDLIANEEMAREMLNDAWEVFQTYWERANKENNPNIHNTRNEA